MTAAVVTFRVDDRKALEARVEASGAKTRSDFLRKLLEGAEGVWVAYYPDYSGIIPYASEMDALRAANGTSMEVKYVKFGEGI